MALIYRDKETGEQYEMTHVTLPNGKLGRLGELEVAGTLADPIYEAKAIEESDDGKILNVYLVTWVVLEGWDYDDLEEPCCDWGCCSWNDYDVELL